MANKNGIEVKSNDEKQTASKTQPPIAAGGKVLCTHDGVLLKKASAEYLRELNTSGALSLIEFSTPRQCVLLDWQPNLSILVANDIDGQDDWSLVEKITTRMRTISECSVTNDAVHCDNVPSSPRASSCIRLQAMRIPLEELCTIDVRHRKQILKFIRKDDRRVHCEFFFQHGNADQFVHAMLDMHLIESTAHTRGGEQYEILTGDTRKLKRTFAELDIGEIKATAIRSDGWLPNRVVEFLVSVPDLVQPRHTHTMRPNAINFGEREISAPESSNSANSSGSQSRAETTTDKSASPNHILSFEQHPLPEYQLRARGEPLSREQWLAFQTEDGRISDVERVKEIIFDGGIEQDLRKEVWKYLLNYYSWSDTSAERTKHRRVKSTEYYRMKTQWFSMTKVQEMNFAAFRETKSQILKDVQRTDRESTDIFSGDNNFNVGLLYSILMTYAMYNFDIGYGQGMNDILERIYEIQEDEVDTFWCFVGFMDIVQENFTRHQKSMKKQLRQLQHLVQYTNPRLFNYMLANEAADMSCCIRWLIIWYKRELSKADLFKLWECLWTRPRCLNYQLLLAAAFLHIETDTMIANNCDYSGIVRHLNDHSGQWDVERSLQLSDAIYRQLKDDECLPNDIRQMIGKPVLSAASSHSTTSDEEFDENFEYNKSPAIPEEGKCLEQELLDYACDQSTFMNFC